MQEFLHQQYHPSIYFKPGHARKARHAQKRSDAKRSARKKEPPKEFDNAPCAKAESEKEFDGCRIPFRFPLSRMAHCQTLSVALFSTRLSRVDVALFRQSEWSQRRRLGKQGVVSRFVFPKPTPTKIHKGKSLKNLPYNFLKQNLPYDFLKHSSDPSKIWIIKRHLRKNGKGKSNLQKK